MAICVLTLGLKLWLLPNWYSTNNKNVALTYDAPISDAAFDAMVKEKIGLSTPLSLAKIARFKGLKLGVAGTSTVVIQPKTSVWSLIKLLVRYQREQKLVTILSHWDYNQFQKQLSNQFDWSPVQLGEEIMDPTNHKRWNEQTWLKYKGVDPYNWQAIAILQREGRISNAELAERVSLSASACLRRVKQLEENGVIGQYVALLNPKALGQHGTCFSIINLQTMNDAVLKGFEQAVRDEPEILDCFYVAGANDYLVRFAYRDAEDLERFHTQVLMRLPGVERSNSMLVLRTVKKTTALPV